MEGRGGEQRGRLKDVEVVVDQNCATASIDRITASKARCDLCRLCTQPNVGYVKVASRGAPLAPILAIGEAPGYDESRLGQAFVGPAGQHTEDLLRAAKIPVDAVRWANTTACFPYTDEPGSPQPKPRTPNFQAETMHCVGYLWDEIERTQPKVIVTLGAYASFVVTGREPSSISKECGRSHTVNIRGREYTVITCVHPAADLRSPTRAYSNAIQQAFQSAYDLTRDVHLPVATTVFNSTMEARHFLRGILERYRAGEITCIGFDMEWDTEVRVRGERVDQSQSFTDLYNPDKKITMVSFAYDGSEGFAIPLDHPESCVNLDEILPLLQEVLSTVPIVCHNYLKAEGAWATMKLGVTPTLAYDTMLASFVLQMKTCSHGLKQQSIMHLGWSDWSRKLEAYVFGKAPGERSYRNAPLDMLGPYAAIDPAASMALKAKYEPRIAEAKLERPLALLHRASRVFLQMELRAARVDLSELDRLNREYPQLLEQQLHVLQSYPEVRRYVERRQAALDKSIEGTKRRRPVFAFNPTAAEHLGDIVYGEFGCVVPLLTKKEQKHALSCSLPLKAGDTTIPAQFVTRKSNALWIGDLDGDDFGERVKVDHKQSTSSLVVLKEPLRFDHQPDVTQVYSGSPPTDDKTLSWIMRQTECQTCHGDGTVELQDAAKTLVPCSACDGLGRQPEARQLFKFLSARRAYVKIAKILSSYVQKLGHYVVPGSNRLVFNYLLHGTHTGRLASRDYAVHTTPDQSDIKRLFISEWHREGGLMLSIDQSQIEMRVMASVTGDPLFVTFFHQCPKCQYVGTRADGGMCPTCRVPLGGDMHRMIASETFGKPIGDITSTERSAAKAIGFGILYGRGAASIAAATGMTDARAEALIAQFFARFSRTKQWVAERHQDFLKRGYVTTSFGRRLYLNGFDVLSKLPPNERRSKRALMLEAEGCRQSQNYPIQSEASDLTLLGVLTLSERLRETGYRSRVWGTTHDSVEIDVAPGELFQVLPLVQTCMIDEVYTQCPWLRVPLAVDAKLGRRWNASVGLEQVDGTTLHLKGKKAFFEELVQQFTLGGERVRALVTKEYDDPDELKMTIQKTYRGNTGGLRCVKGAIEVLAA